MISQIQSIHVVLTTEVPFNISMLKDFNPVIYLRVNCSDFQRINLVKFDIVACHAMAFFFFMFSYILRSKMIRKSLHF